MKIPRWLHAVYAHVAGYFWLPCPICGDNFGGHEIHYAREHESLMTSLGGGMCVCLKPECQAEARRRNEATGRVFTREATYYDTSMQNMAIRIPPGGSMHVRLRSSPSQGIDK